MLRLTKAGRQRNLGDAFRRTRKALFCLFDPEHKHVIVRRSAHGFLEGPDEVALAQPSYRRKVVKRYVLPEIGADEILDAPEAVARQAASGAGAPCSAAFLADAGNVSD